MKKDKIIKNTCGAISLMLALLIVPFYAVAGILVEVSRYQSALTGLDDAMNTSALSVLAEYDAFLQSRFGLLAMAQKDDPSMTGGYAGATSLEKTFKKYLKAQDTTDTRSFRTTDVNAAGVYPLADMDILRAQILDYSTLTIPTMMVYEFGGDGLQKMITEVQNSIPYLKFLKVGSAVADAATKKLDVVDKIKAAKESVQSLSEKTKAYNAAHSMLNDALNELKQVTKEKPGEGASDQEIETYNKRYEEALDKAQAAKKDYVKKLEKELQSTSSLNEDLKGVAEAQSAASDGLINIGKVAIEVVGDNATTKVDPNGKSTTLSGQIEDVKKSLEKKDLKQKEREALQTRLEGLKKQQVELKNIDNAVNAAAAGMDSSQANKFLQDYNTDSCTTAIQGLQKELSQIKDLDLSMLGDEGQIAEIQSSLHLTDMSKLSDAKNFTVLLKEAELLRDKADSNVSLFSSIAEALSAIMSLSVTYDPKLQSVIDTDYYNENFGGLPGEKDRRDSAYSLESPYEQQDEILAQANLYAMDIVNDVMDMTVWLNGVSSGQSIDEFKEGQGLTKIGKLIQSMSSMLNMVTMGAQIISNLTNITSEVGDHTYLVGYLNYMTTNRTDYDSKKTMSGVSIKDAGGLAPEVEKSQNNLTAILSAKEEINYSFCGAETEYLLFGNKHEKANQRALFYTILALRVALDYNPVTSNIEAMALCSGLAGALSLFGIPYKATEMLAKTFLVVAEAFLDTVLICNGAEDIPFIKASSDIHLCAKGLPALIESVQNLVVMTEAQKKEMEAKLKKIEIGGAIVGDMGSDGESAKDLVSLEGSKGAYIGDNKLCMTYERCLLIMMMVWNEKDLVKRFSNLVEMEAAQKNMADQNSLSGDLFGNRPEFDLDRAYTALRMNVRGEFVSVLPVPTFSKNSIWKTDRVMYRGY